MENKLIENIIDMLAYNEKQNINESYIGNEIFWIWDRPFFSKVRNISGKIDMEGKERCENMSESRMHAKRENINHKVLDFIF